MRRSRCSQWHHISTLGMRSSKNMPPSSTLDLKRRDRSPWCMISITEYNSMNSKINMVQKEDEAHENIEENQAMRKKNKDIAKIRPLLKMMTSKQHMVEAKAEHTVVDGQDRGHIETNPSRSTFRSKQKSWRMWTRSQWESKLTASSNSVKE